MSSQVIFCCPRLLFDDISFEEHQVSKEPPFIFGILRLSYKRPIINLLPNQRANRERKNASSSWHTILEAFDIHVIPIPSI
jgi:hypothetical protein